jgi:MoxR-like ATPase
VESIIAGIKIQAHKDFRFVATMNDDSSTFEIPEYIHSRLQPQIYLNFPSQDEEKAILKKNLPYTSEELLNTVSSFLNTSHEMDEDFTVRDGINLASYAMRLMKFEKISLEESFNKSVSMILGDQAREIMDAKLKKKKRTRIKPDSGPQGLI